LIAQAYDEDLTDTVSIKRLITGGKVMSIMEILDGLYQDHPDWTDEQIIEYVNLIINHR
jgi:hypothetical protein